MVIDYRPRTVDQIRDGIRCDRVFFFGNFTSHQGDWVCEPFVACELIHFFSALVVAIYRDDGQTFVPVLIVQGSEVRRLDAACATSDSPEGDDGDSSANHLVQV